MNVLDFKKDMGLWHGVLTVSLCGSMTNIQVQEIISLIYVMCIWCLLFLPGTRRIKGHCFFPGRDEQNTHYQCSLRSNEGLSSLLGPEGPRP